jgi:VanZ family protein
MSSVPRSLAYRRHWLVLGLVLVFAVIVSSLAPWVSTPGTYPGFDKMEHVAAYLVLMVWFAGLHPRHAWRWLALALLAMGVLLELAQGAMHLSRTADVRDVVANAAGVGLGVVASAAGLASWPYRLETWLTRR